MDYREFCTRMRQEVSQFALEQRASSAGFLVWYLENYFRLEIQEAIDSVCDQPNDKGIDGLFVDDEEEVIYLFQSKFSPNDNQDQGDNEIRNFIGARQWFQTEDTVRGLLSSTASFYLKSIVEGNHIAEKTHYKLVSVFVTNKTFNRHANEFISVSDSLEAYDSKTLFTRYTYFADADISFPPVDLQLANTSRIEYDFPDGVHTKVYCIKAKELLQLQGIQDRTLFYKNVRYGVGNTRVNKSIRETISAPDEHKSFFLYHNGITIICDHLVEDLEASRINIGGYAVINGCQSMLSFFENKENLSSGLSVLVKIIDINRTSPLIRKITTYANNQNAISLQDLRSNDSVQREIQREFETLFGGTVTYGRKRGELGTRGELAIDKDFAAQLISTVYLGAPHNTHLKQKLFGEDYTKVFSRKVNADKIYLAAIIHQTIQSRVDLLTNPSIRDYGLAIFFFCYSLSEIMKMDEIGLLILDAPREYVTHHNGVLKGTLEKVWQLITPDINFEIDEYTREQGFFDYKNLFKNSEFVKSMGAKIKADYTRSTRRNIQDSFSRIYTSLSGT